MCQYCKNTFILFLSQRNTILIENNHRRIRYILCCKMSWLRYLGVFLWISIKKDSKWNNIHLESFQHCIWKLIFYTQLFNDSFYYFATYFYDVNTFRKSDCRSRCSFSIPMVSVLPVICCNSWSNIILFSVFSKRI